MENYLKNSVDQRMKLEKYNKKLVKEIIMLVSVSVKENILILLSYKQETMTVHEEHFK